MAINFFVGWSQQELEAELRAAQEDLAAGKSTISSQAGEVRSGAAVELSAQERIKLILRALNKVNPEEYPVADVTAITSTRAAFSGAAWD
jgi:hypothetical protein